MYHNDIKSIHKSYLFIKSFIKLLIIKITIVFLLLFTLKQIIFFLMIINFQLLYLYLLITFVMKITTHTKEL